MQKGFDNLISQLKKCELCKEKFGFQPHPIILGNVNSKIVQMIECHQKFAMKYGLKRN